MLNIIIKLRKSIRFVIISIFTTSLKTSFFHRWVCSLDMLIRKDLPSHIWHMDAFFEAWQKQQQRKDSSIQIDWFMFALFPNIKTKLQCKQLLNSIITFAIYQRRIQSRFTHLAKTEWVENALVWACLFARAESNDDYNNDVSVYWADSTLNYCKDATKVNRQKEQSIQKKNQMKGVPFMGKKKRKKNRKDWKDSKIEEIVWYKNFYRRTVI